MFLEEKALDAEGKLTVPLPLAINKVGHNIHELLDEFKAVSFDTRLADVCRLLGFERPVIPQSMYICKQPGIGGAVRPHQDGCFLYTRPQTCVGFWWPLEDCKSELGGSGGATVAAVAVVAGACSPLWPRCHRLASSCRRRLRCWCCYCSQQRVPVGCPR